MAFPPQQLPRTPQPRHRTWSQRLVLLASIGVSVAALIAALAMVLVQHNLNQIKRIDTETAPVGATTKATTPLTLESLTAGLVKTSILESDPATSLAPLVTQPPGSIKAVNFLMTGSDNRSCIDRNSPLDRKSTRLNSSHSQQSRMPSSA